MLKYYIENLSNYDIKNLKYKNNFDYEDLILTMNELIKIEKDNYVRYILEEKDPTIIHNFVNNNNVYIDNSYFKKCNTVYQIPYTHEKISVKYCKYKIDNKYKVYFIKEFVNNELVDYYFSSSENIDIVQNSIFTFLNKLTNI
tara:strand:+ start:625 stop:1053 length:429 start_codon:yes stop_codon:yes gene_type:complete